MFMSDPHIDKADAKKLIKEIVSIAHCNSVYEKLLLLLFDKHINITDSMDDNKILQINVHRVFKRKELWNNVPLRKTELALAPQR
jgi:F0F1-type ATP synthase delta subunit